jgi:cytochrome c oxidase subunit IV
MRSRNRTGKEVYRINTTMFLGLAVWIFGFALMTAGWLVDVLFERYGAIPARILYKTGAIIVGVPIIYLLWKTSGLIYTHRLDIVLFLRDASNAIQTLMKAL